MMEAWKFDGSEMGQVAHRCHQKLKVVRWSKRTALLFQWRTEVSDGRNGEVERGIIKPRKRNKRDTNVYSGNLRRLPRKKDVGGC